MVCAHPSFPFNLLSALILLSILLGVIQGGMDNAAQDAIKRKTKDNQIKQIVKQRPKARPYVPLLIDAFERLDVYNDGSLSKKEVRHF